MRTAHLVLQWSHAFSDVETIASDTSSGLYCPLQWSHAFSDVETTILRRRLRQLNRLQWSHAFSDVETPRHEGCPRAGAAASMEPRLLRRGNQRKTAGDGRRAVASMEPRLLRRGNSSPWTGLEIRARLQWSHAFSDVETRSAGRRLVISPRFNGATPSQTWKHCLLRHLCMSCQSFNGATPSQTWKLPQSERPIRLEWRFNGATPSQTWKRNAERLVLRDLAERLQWSHAFSDVETRCGTRLAETATRLQWSHAFSDVETAALVGIVVDNLLLQWSHAFSDVETSYSSW